MRRALRVCCGALIGVAAVGCLSHLASADDATVDDLLQKMLSFPVRIVDPDGLPVAGAKVTPWALRSSQGHGFWKGKKLPLAEPPELTTDADSCCDVPYPRYTYADELVSTLAVTLRIDHPDFAHVEYEDVNVPFEEKGPHVAKLDRGVRVEVVPLEDDKAAALENLWVLTSDDRGWGVKAESIKGPDGALHLAPMPAGKYQLMLVRTDGERATHFSRIVDLDLEAGGPVRKDVSLALAVRLAGRVSDDVPRPVRQGRAKFETLAADAKRQNVSWFSWAPIDEDGTFTVDAWPADEAIQVIALTDGWSATSGNAPAGAESPEITGTPRPQVFLPVELKRGWTVEMSPLVRCEIETVDEKGKPLAGVSVGSYTSVWWWNHGSQMYCSPLVQAECTLTVGDYKDCASSMYPEPFAAMTDAEGRAVMATPAASERFYAKSDQYEVPVNRGDRYRELEVVAGQTAHIRFEMQPKGTEKLGDWDKLAGILFGCQGEQCRRLISDPDFRFKMGEVGRQLDEAAAKGDNSAIPPAYRAIGAAFDELGDRLEAAKWRRKADSAAAKLAPTKE